MQLVCVCCVCNTACVCCFSALLDLLRSSLFEGFMAVYSELLVEMQRTDNAELLQNCALQLWFDVRYLTSLLTSSERSTDKVIGGYFLPLCVFMGVTCGDHGRTTPWGRPLNHIHWSFPTTYIHILFASMCMLNCCTQEYISHWFIQYFYKCDVAVLLKGIH